MKIYIINIGDELLIGQVANLNASWIAEQTSKLGAEIVAIRVVGDSSLAINSALREASKVADVVILTGGLGPTNDDITKNILCRFVKRKLVFSKSAFEDMSELFAQRGWTMNAINEGQAMVPEKSIVISNKYGTAPGIWVEENTVIYVAVPGVPFEMKAMMDREILPLLSKRIKGLLVIHKTVCTIGMGETALAELIMDWERKLPTDFKLAYLPSPGLVRLRLTAKGKNGTKLTAQVHAEIEKLKKIIGEHIFGYDTDTPEAVIGKELKRLNKSLSVAESCTGGYLAHKVTSVAGSSAYFKGSVVAYSNMIKEKLLEVKHRTIEQYGAVSEETVKEMAANCRIKLGTDFAVAISGVAGPDGGTKQKPVGTVCIAIAKPGKVSAHTFQFGNLRMVNIERAAVMAMNLLIKEVREK